MTVPVKASLILGWPINRSGNLSQRGGDGSVISQQITKSLSRGIQYTDDRHLVTFAPTGSGKGVGVIIPNLLHYSGPAIVIDPKGENFAVTSRFRQTFLNQRVFLLDPFHAVSDACLERLGVERHRLNPLDLCQLSTASSDTDAQMLAELFAGDGQSDTEPFWDNSAKRLIAGLLAHEMETARRDNRGARLSNVVNRLFSDDPVYSMEVLLDTEKPSPFVRKSISGGLLAIEAKVTQTGIVSVAQSYFSLFTSGRLIEYLDTSSVRLKDIQGRVDYTLYVVIPPTKLHSHRTLLKVWIGVLMHSIMERRSQPEQRTLFVLDECANLGEMEILRKAVTLLRGYGLQVWMFFQDLGQLQGLYVDSGTMINNCGVLQAFGIGRLSAADPLAKIIGTFRSKELLQLDDRQQVLSITPGGVNVARMARYYDDEAFAGRFDENPLVKKSLLNPRAPNVRTIRMDINI